MRMEREESMEVGAFLGVRREEVSGRVGEEVT
jgi:hypothetical protein